MRYRDIILARALDKGKKGMAVGWPLMLGVAGGGGTETTVTGVSPLLLAAALKKPIKSLTQYGLCSQADTPTPAASVPIMCNNGALTMVDDELPAGYKRVLGFKCNNNAMWEITGFKLKGSDTVRISFSIDGACNVWGCYQGTDATDNYDLYASVSSGAKYLRYGDGTYLSYFSNASLGVRFDVVYTPNGTTGMPQDSTWTPKTFTSANDLLIGSTTVGGTSSKMKGNFYGNIVVDGRLKLIPCERVSDSVLGYYDTYSETFYEPYTGYDGAESLGYDGSHYTLAVVGTDEVISVRGKNLYNPSARTNNRYLNSSGTRVYDEKSSFSAAIPVQYGLTYTFSGISSESGTNSKRVVVYTDNENPPLETSVVAVESTAVIGAGQPYSVSITVNDATAKYLRVSFNTADTDVMVEVGSSATTYQPYVAPQTASAPDLFAVGDYADEVEIISGAVTRKVGVKVLDGTETGWSRDSSAGTFKITMVGVKGTSGAECVCSHFVYKASDLANGNISTTLVPFAFNLVLIFKVTDYTSLDAWKEYLAAQYAAGTPVIVIYPLFDAATETVTAQPITLAAGDNTITATANVSPIELEATYMKGE